MVVVKTPSEGKPSMGKPALNLSTVTRVGLDLAKRVFQVHAVDAKGGRCHAGSGLVISLVAR
jgi:hypothetical protein